jgi:hypothetical protein
MTNKMRTISAATAFKFQVLLSATICMYVRTTYVRNIQIYIHIYYIYIHLSSRSNHIPYSMWSSNGILFFIT